MARLAVLAIAEQTRPDQGGIGDDEGVTAPQFPQFIDGKRAGVLPRDKGAHRRISQRRFRRVVTPPDRRFRRLKCYVFTHSQSLTCAAPD